MKKWNCELKNPPLKITVGTKLHLSCEGKIGASLNKELSIVFQKKEDAYKLQVLKVLDVKTDRIDLQVASYKPGLIQGSFIVTDGSQSFSVENLSLKVDSVLSKNKETKAHGPFGPWKEPISFWYSFSFGLTSALFLVVTGLLLFRYFSRKKRAERVKERLQGQWPSKVFIREFRKLDKNSSNVILELETLFRTFLENLFYIQALKRKPSQILHDLKKYETVIYKKHSYQIRQILNELNNFKKQNANEEIHFKLEKTCKDLVFLLEKETRL